MARDEECAAHRHAARAQHLMQRLAIEHVHRDVLHAVGLTVIEYAHAARMIEPCEDARLTCQSLLEALTSRAFSAYRKHLERAVLLEPHMSSAIDKAHPTAARRRENLVAL